MQMREGRGERKFNKVKKEIKEIRFLYFMPKHLETQKNTFVKSIYRSFTFIQVISVPLTIIADFFRYQKHRCVIVTRRNMFDFKNKLKRWDRHFRHIVFRTWKRPRTGELLPRKVLISVTGAELWFLCHSQLLLSLCLIDAHYCHITKHKWLLFLCTKNAGVSVLPR